MSGTRLLFRTAPATEPAGCARTGADLLIVAHGERGGAGDNAALVRLARSVGKAGRFDRVRAGVLKGAPSVERALGAGHCVRAAIPARLRAALGPGRDYAIHRPLGLEPGLAGVIADVAGAALRGAGHRPSQGTLLLVGHGSSKSGESRAATEWQAARVRAFGLFAEVRTAYLEQAPFLPAALADLGATPCAVVGLFSGAGLHAAEDVPAAIAAAGARGAHYAGPISAAPGIARLIAASVGEWLREDKGRESSAPGADARSCALAR